MTNKIKLLHDFAFVNANEVLMLRTGLVLFYILYLYFLLSTNPIKIAKPTTN